MTSTDHIAAAFTNGDRDAINQASAELYETWLNLSRLIHQRADSTSDPEFAEYLRSKAATFDGAAEGIGGYKPRWLVTFTTARPVRLHADTADDAKAQALRRARRRLFSTVPTASQIASVAQIG